MLPLIYSYSILMVVMVQGFEASYMFHHGIWCLIYYFIMTFQTTASREREMASTRDIFSSYQMLTGRQLGTTPEEYIKQRDKMWRLPKILGICLIIAAQCCFMFGKDETISEAYPMVMINGSYASIKITDEENNICSGRLNLDVNGRTVFEKFNNIKIEPLSKLDAARYDIETMNAPVTVRSLTTKKWFFIKSTDYSTILYVPEAE